MQEPTSIFSARLRELRKSMHLTQEDIANTLNIHRTTYTKYETGKANPDQKCLLQLAELFHVSVDHLLGRDPEPSPLCLQDGSASLTRATWRGFCRERYDLLNQSESRAMRTATSASCGVRLRICRA